MASDVLFQDLGHLCLGDAFVESSFHPLSKVVDDHLDILVSMRGFQNHRPDDIHTPSWKRPWRCQRVQGLGNIHPILIVSATMARPHMLDAIVLHGVPKVASSHTFPSQQGSTSMCSKQALVCLVHQMVSKVVSWFLLYRTSPPRRIAWWTSSHHLWLQMSIHHLWYKP